MRVYYNEFDPFAAAWLRELMADDLIAKGDVDERSIADVQPADLAGYDQCHFFAGIGGWPYALALAGWGDRPVWTGSCPCQPFSVAGRGAGESDPRHLWPEFRRLIAECQPPVVFGEQVASKAGRDWLTGVRADLEGLGYGVGAADLCAASLGAPHIRQRLWWVGERVDDAPGPRYEPEGQRAEGETRDTAWVRGPERGRPACGLADAEHTEWGADLSRGDNGNREDAGRPKGTGDAERCGAPCGLADAAAQRPEEHDGDEVGRVPVQQGASRGLADCQHPGLEGYAGDGDNGDEPRRLDADTAGSVAASGDPRNPWSSAVWHPCRDGKWRRIPVEPGVQFVVDGVSGGVVPGGMSGEAGPEGEAVSLFPLAGATPNRVGLLKGAGNAIVAPLAAHFIEAYMEC